MKIIYEPGDYVRVDDDMGAPEESANNELLLLHLVNESQKLWRARVYESDADVQIGTELYIEEKWFSPS